MKRGLKTPAQLGFVAARLFGPEGGDSHGLPGTIDTSASSNGSTIYDQLYLDQCHGWFTRETRASKTPRPEPMFMSSIIKTHEKPLRKKSAPSKTRMKPKRLTKCLDLSSLPSVSQCTTSTAEPSQEWPGCVGCSAEKNSEITSSNFFKLLSNNVLICSAHRFITHWMLDFGKDKHVAEKERTDFAAEWKPESEDVQAEFEVPFSVTEDRRLVAGVDRFGDDAWETILSEFYFAPNRLPEDLKTRWQQLRPVV